MRAISGSRAKLATHPSSASYPHGSFRPGCSCSYQKFTYGIVPGGTSGVGSAFSEDSADGLAVKVAYSRTAVVVPRVSLASGGCDSWEIAENTSAGKLSHTAAVHTDHASAYTPPILPAEKHSPRSLTLTLSEVLDPLLRRIQMHPRDPRTESHSAKRSSTRTCIPWRRRLLLRPCLQQLSLGGIAQDVEHMEGVCGYEQG